jgi:Flp pilus assembly protein TadB
MIAERAVSLVPFSNPFIVITESIGDRWRARTVARNEMEEAFAASLRVVAASVRAGLTLEHAFLSAADRSTERTVSHAFRMASARLRSGMTSRMTMERFSADLPIEGSALLSTLLEVQARSGGDPGQACHRLAQVLHERGRLRKEAKSATAMARFAARAVILLPLIAALGWIILNPNGVIGLLQSGGWLLLLPTFLGLSIGAWAVRRCAHESLRFSVSNSQPRRGLLLRVCGEEVPTMRGRMRLFLAFVVPAVVMTASTGGGFMTWCMVVATGIACWRYPKSVIASRKSAMESVVARGLPELLELTVAFLSAGATPRDALLGSLGHGSSELSQELESVRAGVALGRSPAASYAASAVSGVSHALDSWAFALTAGDRLGAPAITVLETLLVDARSTLREEFRQRAATSGPRMQLITVLIIVPSVLWAVLALTSLGLARQLTSSGLL